MTSADEDAANARVDVHHPGPPSKHQVAVMIWLAVFPTLIALNLLLGSMLRNLNLVLRTFILVSLAVPVVVYALMPQLHRARTSFLHRRLSQTSPTNTRIRHQ